MDRLRQRLSVASQAVATLRELAIRTAPSKIERDAAIQRFEYSFEATWKAAQRFLSVVEGVEAGSPKSAIRACHEAGLPYNEGLAEAICKRLPGHLATLEAWLGAMQNRVPAKL